MEARLTGGGFRIEALTPERQPVGRSSTTEWRWEVHKTEGGSHALHLTLSALITVEGERTPRAVRTFDREIEIQVTLRQRITGFVGDNWQWLWAALIVPLLGLAAGSVKARRNRRDEGVETSYVQAQEARRGIGAGTARTTRSQSPGHGRPVRVVASANNAARRTPTKTAVREPFQASALFSVGAPRFELGTSSVPPG